MKTKYKFISGDEPSDEQLNQLMKDVLVDVKERSIVAENKQKKLRIEYNEELKARFKNI